MIHSSKFVILILHVTIFHLAYPESQPVKQEKKSTRSKKKRKDGESLERKDSGELSRKKKDGESLEIEDSGELSRKKKELLRIAKKYQINELIARCVHDPVPRVALSSVYFLNFNSHP